jgi:hypothetical protein
MFRLARGADIIEYGSAAELFKTRRRSWHNNLIFMSY